MVKAKKYSYLKHTADAKFQAFGSSLEETFVNAAMATAALMWDYTQIKPRKRHPVEVSGRDFEQLLFSFLEEILFLLDSQMFLLHSVEEVRIERDEEKLVLNAFFLGDDSRHDYEIYGDVKAITYNEMRIERNDRYLVQVVVDM